MFTSNTIQANGISQHYYRSGGDKPPLVMLHGFTDDGACWLPVAEVLAADYDVIMPDARGHGKSARIAGIGFGNDLMAADAAALITALELKRPAVMGHSMGGLNSLILTATYPDLVGCLIMEDPLLPQPSTPQADAERAVFLSNWANGVRQMQQLSLEALIAEEQQRNPRWSAAELQPWAESKHMLDIAVFDGDSPQRYLWTKLMPQVQCPVLLIYGDNNTLVNEALAQEAAKVWKQGEAVQITNAGHCIRRDNLPDFMRVVREFLSKYYGSRVL